MWHSAVLASGLGDPWFPCHRQILIGTDTTSGPEILFHCRFGSARVYRLSLRSLQWLYSTTTTRSSPGLSLPLSSRPASVAMERRTEPERVGARGSSPGTSSTVGRD